MKPFILRKSPICGCFVLYGYNEAGYFVMFSALKHYQSFGDFLVDLNRKDLTNA